ncbi:unnamed protein product [Adineta steineri]|uniref:Reverse transcriptase n=1 Tax=Adineta steineri TaxID=433720 RepID=A0A815UYA9_9BILA|nr:unnamed protein product [Adineta steineri]
MQLGAEIISFSALVTEHLCVDLILGIDFLTFFVAKIDVDLRQLSLKHNGRWITLNVDDTLRSSFVPIRSVSNVILPSKSTIDIVVSSPVSSLSSILIPTSIFLEQPHLSTPQKNLNIQHHVSSLSVTNHSAVTQTIPHDFCFGYLQLPPPSKSFSEQISDLCAKHNANKNKHIRSSTLINQSPLQQRNSTTTPSRPRILSKYLQASVITTHPSFASSLAADLAKLVEHLSDTAERNSVSSLLSRFSSIFDTSKHNISNIVIDQVFNTIPHSPPALRPHRNPHHREETQKLIDEFLDAGIIHESHSPYAAPAFIVPRKGNRPGRLVVDYRALNKITISDASPLPHIEDTLQDLGKGFKYFSKLDLKTGYHQFRIPPQDREKTAFVVSFGHYEYSVLPMGPTNGPACFQKTMFNLLKPCYDFARVYLDDVIIYSTTLQQHLHHLNLVFTIFNSNKIVLSPTKCEIAVTKVEFLGHIVSEHTLTPTTTAIQVILDLREPRTLKEANKFLGGLAYYRKFVPEFARLAAPLHKITNLTRDKRHLFKWTDEHSRAFVALQHMLTNELYLHFPVEGYPLHLSTDASGIATGGVLFQEINGERRNIFYHSKLLSAIERKYSVPEQEALAIFQCLQRMRTYVLGRIIYVHTDHCPICGLLQKPVNNRRIERVANLIQEYNIAEMKHISGKSNCLPDFLSRPFDDPLFDVPYGVESKQPLSSLSMALPVTPGISPMVLRPRLKPTPITDVAIPDDEFKTDTDDTVDSTSSSPILTSPSPNTFNCHALKQEQDNDPDIQLIVAQLHNPDPASHTSSSFLIKDDLLHKVVTLSPTSPVTTAVPYLPTSMIQSLLTAMHDDPYQGGHFSTDKMYSKLASRYWWPHMRDSLRLHVQACTLCQQYNYNRQKKPGHLHPIPPTNIPYSVISMDFCGPFVESPRENKFVLIISDLFTRHVTAVATSTNTAEITAMALYREVFCRYGVCSTLLTDQGTHFNNNLMRALTHLFGYNHIYSTAYHPQTNAVTERFNASFKVQISKLEDKHHHNWDDYLDPVVFAYNTAKHKTTQFSPFELLFGRSPQLPIDLPPQFYTFARPNICFENLQRILQVYHQQAQNNIIAQQQSNKVRYDKHRSDPHFQIGDHVFTKIFTARGSLDPRYSSEPSIVTEVRHPTYFVRNESTGVVKRFHVSDIRPVIEAYNFDSTTY